MAQAASAAPLGTEFTYQGRLVSDGIPLTGAADLQFSLFATEIGGSPVGFFGPLSNVSVVNGLFTVQIDFGPEAFRGDERWLEVQVRTPAGSGPFSTLGPRQKLSGAPYALFALEAGRAQSLALPYTDTISFAGSAITITNTGSGSAISASAAGAAGTAAIHATATGTGRAAEFENLNPASGSSVLQVTSIGLGSAGEFLIDRVNSTKAALRASTNSTANTAKGIHGVAVATSGSGAGVFGESNSPDGAGVHALGSGPTGTALAVQQGAIRVIGAGQNTSTAAFIHRATSSNLICAISCIGTIIDHPMTNGDEDAILFVTQRANTNSESTRGHVVIYDSTLQRWGIFAQPSGNVSEGDRFNVLVIKP